MKKSNYREDFDDEVQFTLKDHKRLKAKKQYRNFDNAIRSKNISALLEYTEYDDEDNYDDEYTIDYK